MAGALNGLGAASSAASTLLPGVAAAAAGLTAGLALTVHAATEFNAGMANVATLIPGATARVNELKTTVQGMAVAVGKSTGDLTGGLYQVISAFGDSADTTRILEINAKAAAAGLATTTDAINLTSAVTKGYGDSSVAAVQKVSDLAFQTVKLGQTTFPELAASMGKVVPIAAALGVTQEELFSQMATLTGVTGSAAEVSTQLRATFQAILKPTAEMGHAIQNVAYDLDQQNKLVGGPLVDNWKRLSAQHAAAVDAYHALTARMTAMDAAGQSNTAEFRKLAAETKAAKSELKPMADAVDKAAAALGQTLVQSVGTTESLSLLSKEAGGNTDTLGKMFGSVEALGAVLALSSGQADTFAEKSAAMADVTGLAAEAFSEQTQGVNKAGFAMEQLRIQGTVLAQKFGDQLLPIVGAATEWLSRLMEVFLGLSPTTMKFIAIGLVAATAVAGITTVVLGLLAVLPALIAGFAAAATIAGVVGAVLTGPLLLAIGAVALAATALYLAWTSNFLGIQDVAAAAWAFLSAQVFVPIQAALADFGAVFLPEFLLAWQNMSTLVQLAWTGLTDFLMPAIDAFAVFWTTNWTTIQSVLQLVWDAMTLLVKVAWDVLSTLILTALDVLQGDWSGAWDRIKGLLQRTWDAMGSLVGRALNLLQAALTAAWGAISSDVSKWWGTVVADLARIWNDISNNVTAVVNGIGAFLQQSWDAINKTAGEWWTTIKDTIWNSISPLLDLVTGLVKGINETFSKIVPPKIEMPTVAGVKIGSSPAATVAAAVQGGIDWGKLNAENQGKPRNPDGSVKGSGGGDLPPGGAWLRPVSGSVTQEYGRTAFAVANPGIYPNGIHTGIDLGAGMGTDVFAAQAGRVVSAGWDTSGYGNLIKLDHGAVASLYAHLSGIRVGAGDLVKAGQYIGNVGSTGNSTAAHLHFELRRAGASFNPRELVGLMNGVTNFGGGLAIVGEAGPELVNLPRGVDVIPNHRMASVGGGGATGPTEIHIHVAGSVVTERELADTVMTYFRQKVGTNGSWDAALRGVGGARP